MLPCEAHSRAFCRLPPAAITTLAWVGWVSQIVVNASALPNGLHGTSMPARINRFESIGGLRLSNWDIARAARLMPVGTALQWKAP